MTGIEIGLLALGVYALKPKPTTEISSGNPATDLAIENVITRWKTTAETWARYFSLPVERILAHIVVESNGNPSAIGRDQDMGLMQVTRIAFDDAKQNVQLPESITWDQILWPTKNVMIGTAYLRYCYNKLGSLDLASRGYNQGWPKVRLDNSAGTGYLNLVKQAENKIKNIGV